MILDYGSLLSPEPIKLSFGGTLRKPTLREISKVTFGTFNLYEALLKCTPKEYFTNMASESGKQKWEAFSDEERDSLTMYGVICSEPELQALYVEVLEFFFVERVSFVEGLFVLSHDMHINQDNPTLDSICGVITGDNFMRVLELIQQVCCIYEKTEEEEESPQKFKNELARKLYEKMKKAEKEQEAVKKVQVDKNLSIPNIISAVSNNHPTINPINVWDLTMFELIDSFNRLRESVIFKIDTTRVSVWGDEKKQFDPTLWYKNNHDK